MSWKVSDLVICNKRKFHTRRWASDMACLLFKRKRIKLRTYLCPWCNCWHLTSRIHGEQDGKVYIKRTKKEQNRFSNCS